jgi:CcmD family protein
MEQNLGFLFAAFFVAWLVLLLYVLNLAGRIGSVRRELKRLQEEQESRPGQRERA